MTKIFKLSEFNLSDLMFSDPVNNIVYISHNDGPVLLETNELYCVDGIKKCDTKYSSHELLISLTGKNNINTDIYKTFFESLDNKIINIGKENIELWPFNNKNIAYKSLIRYIDDDNKYYKNGAIKLKFIKSRNFSTLIFDENKKIVNPVDYEKILGGDIFVKLIIELVSIWIRDGVFGLYIKLHQLKISNGNNNRNNVYLFDSDSNSEIENNLGIYDTEIDHKFDSIMINNDDLEYILSD